MNDVRAVAYHEAGHAVVAWFVGCPIRRVTIKAHRTARGRMTPCGDLPYGFDERRELGVCFVTSPEYGLVVITAGNITRFATDLERECARLDDRLRRVDEYERMLMVCTAGEAAQHMATGTLPWQRSWQIGDRAAAVAIWSERSLEEVTHDEMIAAWNRWKRRTRSFLRQPFVWQRVEALAATLLQQQTLTGRQIRRVLRDDRVTW